MKLCRVLGSVVASARHPAFDGRKLLIVEPVDGGASFLAVDDVQAGPGDTVLVNQEGGGNRQVLAMPNAPIRSLIVAIVDDVARTDEPA